ncbi:Uncharacterized protein Adt_39605 [Abeliophyllum distichum]|uniref:Chromo domain-containing protein n=1 Tax=Abeliophyllum distichum TaxID=126358 RepID=A0ABD1Q5J9_9LAMI
MPKRALPPIRVLLRLLLASNRYSLILWILIKVPSLLKRRASFKSGNEISKLLEVILRKHISGIGIVAYRIELLSWCKTHNVLHVSALKPYFADKEDASINKPKRPTFEMKRTGKRVAEAIIDHRVTRTSKKDHQEYLVKWSGCSSEQNTWERVKDLGAFKPLLEEYHANMAPRTSSNQMGENVRARSYS